MMVYQVVPRIHIKNAKPIGEFQYEPDIDGLSFTGKYPFPVQLRVSDGLNKIEVTPMFLKTPFILHGWINLDILMREIDLMKLVFFDKLLLHASCVDDTLIMGFPNSGKTYQTYTSVAKGGTLISEEYTVIHKGVASPYKQTARSCLSRATLEACGMKLTFKEQAQLMLTTVRARLMPFMFEEVIWKEVPVSGKTARVKKIVYGSTGVEIKDYRHVIILTENEFPFMENAFLAAYAIRAGLDIINIQNRQRQLIKDFVRLM